MKRSLKKLKGLPGGPNEKIFSTDGYRSTSPDVNNPFNIIPSGNITMKEKDGSPLRKGPLMGTDNLGNSQIMFPGADYQFPGNMVTETPLAKRGGQFQNSNITATNKLFAVNKLFKKRKKGKRARGIYNPKAKYTYDDGGESGCPDGKVWSNKFKRCVHLIQHEDYLNSPSMNNYGDVPVISSDPIQSLGDSGTDGLTENILEFFDPTGGLSYDDAKEAYSDWQDSKNTHPTFNQSLSMFGAVPGLGKLGKIKYLKNSGAFTKAAFGVIPWQKILNAIDTGQDIKSDNINPSIKKTKKSEWNPPLIKREVTVKPKKANGGQSGCPEGFYNDPVQGCVKIEDPSTFYENWFQNRVMPTPEGQKLLDKIRPEALERSRASVPYIFDENLGPNEAGYYDVDTRQIMLNKFLPEAQIQATKYHERVHDIQAGDKFTSALEKPQGYLVEQNIVEPKAINTGNPEWDKNLKKNYEDIVDPNEIHARVMTLRRLAGFRPDQTITEKDLQDYFKAVKDSGGKLDPDIEDLKGVTKGTKSIVNLLNDMVSTPALQDDLKMAQFGGSQQPCPIGYEWNGIECIPNPFETRPSQRAAVYMDKDGNYQIDPAYQQYSQQKFDVSESNRKAQEFNKLYAQSKNYKRLLKKQGYTPEEIKDRISSVMNINDFRYIDEGPSWVSANEDTGNEFISYNVTDPGDWPGFDQIAAHEWGHVGVDSGANPLKPKEREEFINRINKEQAGVTGVESDLQHDMEPQENRADLVQLRQQLQEAGVFDSTKRKKFTKKDLNKYREIMKSSERNWDNMWNRMFRLYDDDSIIHFMNNVAKNNSNEDVQVAKYGFELDLTEDEIQKYVKGGYVVEDISVPSLTRMQPGGPVPDSTYTPIDPNFLAENPDVYSQIVNKPEVSTGREGSDIGKLRAEYRDKNPMDIFLDEKKRKYLKKNKGLNKAAGVTMENFPEDVLQNFMSEYDYKTNNYAVNKLGKKEGWNPKRRGEWVDELTPGEKDAVAESKYGSKLQPSYWSRSLAGVQELGNAAIKLLPGEQGDVLKYNIPGLTKKEQKEIAESKIGALETLAPMDIPGAAIANLVKNTGLTTGSDYKEQANALAGEKMANVSDTEAMVFNPLTYAGLEGIPELGVNLVKGASRGISAIPETIDVIKSHPSSWFQTSEERLSNPNVWKSLNEEASWKDPLGKYYNWNDTRKLNKAANTEQKLIDAGPFGDSKYVKEVRELLGNKSYDNVVRDIEKSADARALKRSRLPIKPVLNSKGSNLGGGQGRIYLNLNNPDEVIKLGVMPGKKGVMQTLVDTGNKLKQENVAGLENVALPTKAVSISSGPGTEFGAQFMPWLKEPLDPINPIVKDTDGFLRSGTIDAKEKLLETVKKLDSENIGIDYVGQGNIFYDPTSDSYKLVDLNYTSGPGDSWFWNELDKPVKERLAGKIGNWNSDNVTMVPQESIDLAKRMGALPENFSGELSVDEFVNLLKNKNANFKDGGIVSDLSKKEIDELVKKGFIIEEID